MSRRAVCPSCGHDALYWHKHNGCTHPLCTCTATPAEAADMDKSVQRSKRSLW